MTFEHTTVGAPGHPSFTDRRSDARRLIIAAFSIPLLYVLIRYLPVQVFFALTAATALLAVREFYRLYFRHDRMGLELAVGFAATGLLIVGLQWPALFPTQALWAGLLLLVLTSRLMSQRDLRQTLTDSAVLYFGVIYIGFTLGHLLLIRNLEQGVFLVFFLLLVTWGGDTGAYLFGKTLGRHKLAPTISPNKTVEGLFGGLLMAVAMAFVARLWFLSSLTVGDCLALGFVLGGVGVLGDLTESAFKRGAGVKDSGGLIPGHGGILDRVDSLLFSAPVFYYYLTLHVNVVR